MINISLLYNRLNAELLPFCESVSLVEKLSGEFSELKVTLCNVDGRFTREWAAVKGDSVSVSCGFATAEAYTIKSISINKNPRVVQWICKARPGTTKAPKKRGGGSPPPNAGALIDSKLSWSTISSITMRALLEKVCSECGLRAKYTPKSNPGLNNVVRYRESGWAILNRYAKCYGFALRSTADTVTIFKPAEAKTDQKSIELNDELIKSFSIANEIAPARVISSRFDPRSKEIVKSEAGDGEGVSIDVSSYDAVDAGSIYDELSKQMRQIDIIPDAHIVTGALVRYDDQIMCVQELAYNRTADAETMRLTLKEAK